LARSTEDGRARRVYKITADGRAALKRTKAALRELAAEVFDD
jgi:DNA-binding PadR family transcriptional regulator